MDQADCKIVRVIIIIVIIIITIIIMTMLKRDQYTDLRLVVKSLYPGHKISSVQVVFGFLAAHSINLAKRDGLVDILQDKKAVGVTIEKAQKRIISQNCETVKRCTWQ